MPTSRGGGRGSGGASGSANVQFVPAAPSPADTKKGGIYVAEEGGDVWFRRDHFSPVAAAIESAVYLRTAEVPHFLGSFATSAAPSTSPDPSPATPPPAVAATADNLLVGDPTGKGLRLTLSAAGAAGNNWRIVRVVQPSDLAPLTTIVGTSIFPAVNVTRGDTLAELKASIDGSTFPGTTAYVGGADGTEVFTAANWTSAIIQFAGGADVGAAGRIFHYDITTGKVRDALWGAAAWADATSQLTLPLFVDSGGITHNLKYVNPSQTAHGMGVRQRHRRPHGWYSGRQRHLQGARL